MGSVHSKISGRASSRPRGWQHIYSPPRSQKWRITYSCHDTSCTMPRTHSPTHVLLWAEALEKLRLRPCGRIDGNWISFQLANSTPPLSVTDSAFAPSARMHYSLALQDYTSTKYMSVIITFYSPLHAPGRHSKTSYPNRTANAFLRRLPCTIPIPYPCSPPIFVT